ncbi:MAG: penicillin-binding protein 2 [Alphaproteobacteria bacterium]|nr:penicillin-binding protein 2 [Alphaproteobacteria bacterium]
MYDGDTTRTFTRRAVLLAGGKLFLSSLLVGRMYYLQVFKSAKYKMLANENRISVRLIAPPRGLIVDRKDNLIAINHQNFRAELVAEDAGDIDKTLKIFSSIVPLSEDELKKIKKDIRRKRSFMPVTVKEHLRWKDIARIQVNSPDIPGISIDEGLSRYYPYNDAFCHSLGYVGPVSDKELKNSTDPLLEVPGFRVGKAGVESIYENDLRGTSGNKSVEVNAFGRVIRELEREDGNSGAKISLTFDLRLQNYVIKKIGDESASVVVMDVHTGEVLAMASTPGFDPNLFNTGINHKDWNALLKNHKSPLINKPISGLYSPGSTFKMVTALAALEAKVITPDETFDCRGKIKYGTHTFHCWKRYGHGKMNLKDAIKQSCDVYFYEIAKKVGIDKIADMARRLGLGAVTNVGLLHEKHGLIPDHEWKKKTYNERWQPGETLIAAIGQGYVLTTPLQLAVMTSRIANGGFAVTPSIINEISSEETKNINGVLNSKKFDSINVSKKHLKLVRDAMFSVVNERRGTGHSSRIDVGGVKMSGKTGTTQVKRISMQERKKGIIPQKELPWKYRNHALFVGYAPADNPKYAVSVVVEHGGSAGKVAAPIAKEVMEKTLELGI